MAKPRKPAAKVLSFESFNELTETKDIKEIIAIKPIDLKFKHPVQKLASNVYQQSDITWLLGPSGTGKTHLAVSFAINEILSGNKKKIILTRPAVEAGEKLGFLPGIPSEKMLPYMNPIWALIDRCTNGSESTKKLIMNCCETIPLSYMRGLTFLDSVCILDEAQNATKAQMKLFLTRFGHNCKMIITGDPKQSDLPFCDLPDVVKKLEGVNGMGMVYFNKECIVRHPIISEILRRLS